MSKLSTTLFSMINQYIKASLQEAQLSLSNLLSNTEELQRIESVANTLIETLGNNGTVLSCENG